MAIKMVPPTPPPFKEGVVLLCLSLVTANLVYPRVEQISIYDMLHSSLHIGRSVPYIKTF